MSDLVERLNWICDENGDEADALRQFINHRVEVNGQKYSLINLLNSAGIDISVESSGETPDVFLGFC